MAITKNAKKANRSSQTKRVYNVRTKRVLHDVVKSFRTALEKGSVDDAATLLPKVQKALDKAAKRGVIKTNTASRAKSRLTGSLKKKVAK